MTTSPASSGSRNWLVGIWRRLTTSDPAASTAEPGAAAPAQPIENCKDRDRVTLVGRVAKVWVASSSSVSGLNCEIADGSGEVRVVWLGRSDIPGIEVGRSIRITGRVSCRDGARVIYNPNYELN